MSSITQYTSYTYWRPLKISLLISLVTFSMEGFAQSLPSNEYKIKAVFLFNFSKFVEWPSTAFESPVAPFIIAIVGEDPFGSQIDEVVSGEKVQGHPIIIHRHKLMKELEHCHILFVNVKDVHGSNNTSAAIPSKILTVGESPEFSVTGGMIRFITKDNKVKLIINPVAIQAAALVISSKLLRVADILN